MKKSKYLQFAFQPIGYGIGTRTCTVRYFRMKPTLILFIIFSAAVFFTYTTPIVAQDKKTPAESPAADEVYRIKEVDTPPVPKGYRTAPVYPPSLKKTGENEEVILSFVVDKKGVPRDFKVVRSSNRAFEKPAIEAIQQWRFKPAKKNGKPVPCLMQIPIAFKP